MTTPENSQPSVYERTLLMLGGVAATGEDRPNSEFANLLVEMREASRAFAAVMLENGCTPRVAHSPYKDGEDRFWVIRTYDGTNQGRYGGGRLRDDFGLRRGGSSTYYDIVIDAHGGLTTAELYGTSKTDYSRLSFPDLAIKRVFNVDMLTEKPFHCYQVKESFYADLKRASSQNIAKTLAARAIGKM